MVILVLGISFLEHVLEWHNAQETLFFGQAIAAVAGVLIWFKRSH